MCSIYSRSAVQALFCGSFPDRWKRLLSVSGGWCVIVCPHPVSCRESHFTFPHFVSVFLGWNMCCTSSTWLSAVSHAVKSPVLFFHVAKIKSADLPFFLNITKWIFCDATSVILTLILGKGTWPWFSRLISLVSYLVVLHNEENWFKGDNTTCLLEL